MPPTPRLISTTSSNGRWFGASVRDGYQELIGTALKDLLDDPEHPATHERPELGEGIRVVHLRSSRDRTRGAARRIRAPRHFVVYRLRGDVIQVVRILHDAMDLPRHRIHAP
ncbi:type II toxin-antitoxin system RelE/ParE family toxin [Salana multivorans]